jgi:hypothetical protein
MSSRAEISMGLRNSLRRFRRNSGFSVGYFSLAWIFAIITDTRLVALYIVAQHSHWENLYAEERVFLAGNSSFAAELISVSIRLASSRQKLF